MFAVRVKEELGDRLDAEYYNPAALLVLQAFKKLGKVVALGDAISEGYRVVYHGIDNCSSVNDSVPFLSPTQIGKNGEINFEDASFVPSSYRQRYPKGIAIAGELLIEVKGNLSKVSVVPDNFPDGLMISGSLYKASLFNEYDSRYVLSYLKSKHGNILKQRLASNTIIDYIGKDDLYSIALPKLQIGAQRYIGDKVRQAERLREKARSIEQRVSMLHAQYIPAIGSIDFTKKSRRLPSASLTERLDAHFYPSAVEQYIKQTGRPVKQIGNLSTLVTNGQTRPEADQGVLQATVTNLGISFVEGNLRTVTAPTSDSRAFAVHDLLYCNAAHSPDYIGRDITYCQKEGVYPSTEVMVIRVDRGQMPASYLRAYLKTKIGYLQIQSTIRGITAHSYPSDARLLEIPLPAVPSSEQSAWFATDDEMLIAGHCVDISRLLTTASTQLVEHIIEGKFSEADLIAAQKALDAGDRSADRAILASLRVSNAADTAPLIPNLDALYALLDADGTSGQGD